MCSWLWSCEWSQGACFTHQRFPRVCVLSHFSRVWLCVTLWTVACQIPLFIGLSRQEYWSGLPCPPAGDLPDSGIKPVSLISAALAGSIFTTFATWEAYQRFLPAPEWRDLRIQTSIQPFSSAQTQVLEGKNSVFCFSVPPLHITYNNIYLGTELTPETYMSK